MTSGWTRAPLVDCIEKVPAPTKIKTQDFLTEGKYPVVSQEAALINGYWNNEADVVKVKRPLIVFGDHTQVIKYVDFDFVVGADGVKLLQPRSALDPKFFCYQLQSMELETLGYARHFRLLKEQAVQYPTSIPEQQRIVRKLDAAFAALAEAQAHVERNRANARELFESYLNEAHAKHEQGWKQTTLGAEVEILTGFPFKSKQYTDSGTDVKLLRGDNIVQGSLRWEDVKRWPADDTAEYDRYWMKEGDVVLAMDRTWVKAGLKYASLSAEDLPCLLVQRTACLRCGPNLDKQFLRFLIGSKDFTNYVITVQTGIGVPHISGGQISAFKFFMPALAVQKRMAKTLTELEAHTNQLESTYQQKQTQLAGLKKAVLGAAFRGAL